MQKIKNIEQVEKILEENNVKIKDDWVFYNFWQKVDIRDNKEDCWNWMEGKRINKYGYFSSNSTIETLSHRIAYLLTKGFIPKGLEIQHSYNNPSCCNPNHLELGTRSKNARYRVKCGRQYKKFEENDIREILEIYESKRMSHPELKQWQITEPIAKKFDASKNYINDIIVGRIECWHHVYKEFHNDL